MGTATKLALALAAAAAGAYALAYLGKRAAYGQLAGRYGDTEAKDIVASLTFTDRVAAGARALVGSYAVHEGEIYTVH